MFLILFVFGYSLVIYFKVIKPRYGRNTSKTLRKFNKSTTELFNKTRYGRILCVRKSKFNLNTFISIGFVSRYSKFIAVTIIFILFVVLIIVDSLDSPHRLRSLLGIFILLGIGFVFSKHRSEVNSQHSFLLKISPIQIDWNNKNYVADQLPASDMRHDTAVFTRNILHSYGIRS